MWNWFRKWKLNMRLRHVDCQLAALDTAEAELEKGIARFGRTERLLRLCLEICDQRLPLLRERVELLERKCKLILDSIVKVDSSDEHV